MLWTEAENTWSERRNDIDEAKRLRDRQQSLNLRLLDLAHEIELYALKAEDAGQIDKRERTGFQLRAAAIEEFVHVNDSRMDFVMKNEPLHMKAAEKHSELVRMFEEASQGAAKRSE